MSEVKECKIEGCKRPVRAKGYCRVHYQKWRKGEYGHDRFKPCKMEGCTNRRYMKAYCEDHYKSEYLKKAAGESGT